MKRLFFFLLSTRLLSLTACASPTDDPAVAEADLTSIGTGTYVVDARPSPGNHYVQRITFGANKSYEADIVKSSGTTQLVAGTFQILPAQPNDPQSPVQTDKPTLVLKDDSGNGPVSFEFDRSANGALRLYGPARHFSFTMRQDPSYRPAPTSTKVITCTGGTVDAKLTLDRAQNRRGTLSITRKEPADRHDPPTSTVNMTKNEDGPTREYVYFEGSNGEQDFYVNVKKPDFERGTGAVTLNLRWAEGGQEWSVGVSCRWE
jgi:hypothetical protein